MGTTDNDIYIKCNPTDNNGEIIDNNGNTGTAQDSINILNDILQIFDSQSLYNNIGVQTVMAIIFLLIIYNIGNYMFIYYPSSKIAQQLGQQLGQ